MAEMLTYAPDLRSITGGQGEYTMEFLRYEEVPAHLAQKVVAEARREEAARPEQGLEPRSATLEAPMATKDIRTHARAHRPATCADARCCAASAPRLPRRRRPPLGVRAVHGARAHEGWIREGDRAPTTAAAGAPGRAPRSLLGRCRARAAVPAPRATSPRPSPTASERARRRRPRPAPPAPPRATARAASRSARAAPRARGADERRAKTRAARRAVQRLSEHPRTVAGVARSLGRAARWRCDPRRRAAPASSDRRRLGAVLVPLRGRPRRRGRRRPRWPARATSSTSSSRRARRGQRRADEHGSRSAVAAWSLTRAISDR